MFDFHIHTNYSFDCKASVSEQIDAAKKMGLREICFCDHVDLEGIVYEVPPYPADISARARELESMRGSLPDITVRSGVEIGMMNESVSSDSWEFIKDCELDFILGSVHVCEGLDVYIDDFFRDYTMEEGYYRYVKWTSDAIRTCDYFSVLAHYDFCAKYAPFNERTMKYAHAPEHFDSVFRYLAENGKGLEVNTSSWQEAPCWGVDVLKRFKALGGEFVTVGSDAHKTTRVGKRLKDAYDIIRASGFDHITTYEKLKPVLHRL